MKKWSAIAIGDAMVKRAGTVDPSKYPSELFDLYSVPAYDRLIPDVIPGSEIHSSKQIVEPGDVLLSKIVPHIRRAWVVGPARGRRVIASGEWIVFRSDELDPHWLRHLLLSDGFHREFMQTVAGVGGSLLRARPSQVGQIKVLVPPLTEQRSVAAILDQASEVRAKGRDALTRFDDLSRSVFLDMFGNPMTNSKDWPTIDVERVCTLVRGSSPRPQGDPRFFGGPVPRLMISDVTRDGKLVTPRTDSLTIEGAKRSRPCPKGTVVMAVSGNIGLTSMLAVDACIHDGFVGFTKLNLDVLHPRFLLEVLSESKAAHGQSQAGAIFQNITTKDIKALRIIAPPLSEQAAFIERVDAVEGVRADSRRAVAELDNFFASLQYRAFSGDL